MQATAIATRPTVLRWLPFVGAAALAVTPMSDDGASVCPSAVCFGAACPGCGVTRGVRLLLRGDLAASWAYHPLAIPLLLAAAYAWAAWIGWGPRPSRHHAPVLLAVGIGALVAVWVVRLATGTLPPV